MSYIPTKPETLKVKVPSTKTLDRFEIQSLEIRINPNNSNETDIVVTWSEGYMENNTYIVARQRVEIIPTPKMSEIIELKKAVWAKMVARKLISDGNISEVAAIER